MLCGHTKDMTERPTTTLYFSSCMEDLIGAMGDNNFPIWRVTSDAFFVPGRSSKVLVLRHSNVDLMDKIRELAPDKIHYLVDDDFQAGSGDAKLPRGYRKRMARMANGPLQDILDATDQLYVTSDRLREIHAQHKPKLVHPHLVVPVSDLTHFDTDHSLKLVFSGSRSHLSSIRSIVSDLKSFLQKHPEVQFDHFLGRHLKDLKIPNVRDFSRHSWTEFRQHMSSARYHAALLPALKTNFNTARSTTKVLEFACYGAAPVLSRNVAFANLVIDSAIMVDESPGSWLSTLEMLLTNRSFLSGIASANLDLAKKIGDPSNAKKFWCSELEIKG